MAIRLYTKAKEDQYAEMGWPIALCVILAIILALVVDWIICQALNPEYYALKILLNLMVKGD